MRKVATLLHILGLSSLAGGALFMLGTFWGIHALGRFSVFEDNLWILYPEFAISVYSVLYVFYLLGRFLSSEIANEETVSN